MLLSEGEAVRPQRRTAHEEKHALGVYEAPDDGTFGAPNGWAPSREERSEHAFI